MILSFEKLQIYVSRVKHFGQNQLFQSNQKKLFHANDVNERKDSVPDSG